MDDRSQDRELEAKGPAPPKPDPAPVPPKVPGPIPWIPTEPVSQVPSGARSYARVAVMRAIDAGASTVSEPLLRPNPPGARPACAGRYRAGTYPMASLEMSGSYPLSDEAIDEALTRTSPGNYALGHMDGDTFNVFYVGRSDSDVRQRLHEWVGMPSRYKNYASPAKASWAVHRRGQFPVNAPALGHVGNAESSYTRFAYSYARSAEEAYAKEWRNYDAFGGSHRLDNETHPVSAAG